MFCRNAWKETCIDLKITPLSDGLGAEATGVDLSKPVDGETKARLNAAFFENAVLVIREQDLSAPQLLEALQLFGEVFRQHNTRFSVARMPADSLPQQLRPLREREALHS